LTVVERISIRQIRSGIGRKPDHRATLVALGLRRVGAVVKKDATPQVMGMVRKVAYLLEVQEIS